MGGRYVESDENTELLYIDANKLYRWAMIQLLPSGDFEKLDTSQFTRQEIIEDLLMIPDDNECGFIIECDLEYTVEIKEKTENFPLSPYQTKADSELFTSYMNNVNQPNYKPTSKLMYDVPKKNQFYHTL